MSKRPRKARPKYQTIEEFIQKQVADGRFASGSMIWSESRFMRHFDVSANTVQKALAGLVREGVLYRRQGKGTFVSDATPLPAPARLVGVVLPAGSNPDANHFQMELLKGIRSALAPGQTELIFREPGQKLGRAVAGTMLTGALLVTPTLDERDEIHKLGRRLPSVAISSHLEGGGTPYVAFDNRAGARAAVEHLIDRGHERVAFVSGGSRKTAKAERREGYDLALSSRGIEADPELVVTVKSFDERGGEAAAAHLARISPMPTAAFAANDLLALGMIRALQALGTRVPDDVAIAGFDDLAPARYAAPALTTVGGSIRDMGRAAVELLDEVIESPGDEHAPRVLPAKLIVRESS